MFKKIISNLPFSPALVGQLSFYVKRLRKEELTRKLGLIFIALTIIVQYLVVFQPTESANASNETDMVLGGLGTGADRSFSNYLKPYDENTRYLRDTMNYIGVTRQEIVSAKFTSFTVGKKYSWGFAPKFSYEQGEHQYSVANSQNQNITTVFSRPLNLAIGSDTEVWGWVGNSQKLGWFAIMQSCGNLVTDTLPPPPPPPKCKINSELLASDKECKYCPGNITLWIDDPACKPNIIKSKKSNLTQNIDDATKTTAKAGDQISYTITIENNGSKPSSIELNDDLSDVLEYSTLIENGGGSIDNNSKILSWNNLTLEPNAKQSRTFVVKILNDIPATAKGASEQTSFDCKMLNTFGNSTIINIDCPIPKIIETITSEMPKTGASENVLFSCTILFTSTYFYARNKQMKKEIKIIRKHAHSGVI